MFEKESEELAKDIYSHHFDDDVNYPEILKAITVGVQKGLESGYNKAGEWHYVKDKLPPNPKESEYGKSILPLNYICAYALNNEYDDFEIGDFLYMGDGDWLGENENYPIYAWLDKSTEIPKPPKEIKEK